MFSEVFAQELFYAAQHWQSYRLVLGLRVCMSGYIKISNNNNPQDSKYTVMMTWITYIICLHLMVRATKKKYRGIGAV